MQMNLDSASLKNRVVLFQAPQRNLLSLHASNRWSTTTAKGSFAVGREAIRRGDYWEGIVWLLIAASALVSLAFSLGL